MIVPKYFEDFDHLHVNTMPNRAYYIPASRRMEDLVENREASDRFCIRDDSGAVRLAELWP